MLENKPEQERISKEKIPQALKALRSLNAPELPDVPAKVAIRKMRRQIERVLKLGYTYDEVSEVLTGLDIHISGNRIKYLLQEVRKETRSRNKKKADYIEGSDEKQVNEAFPEKELAGSGEFPEASGGEPLNNGNKKSKPKQIYQPQAQTQTQVKQKQQQESLRFEPKSYNNDDL